MKPIVAIEKCPSYHLPQLKKAVQNLLEPWGGMEAFVKPGVKVLLKPNFVHSKPVEFAVTTHPTLVEAVAETVLKCGGHVTIGDSPPLISAHRVARCSGVAEVAERLKIPIVEFRSPSHSFRGRQVYTRNIATPHLESSLQNYDVIINLPKLKSHNQMLVTGAVKNLFGCVTGRRKALRHFIHKNSPQDFAAMLLALSEKVAPELTIVDAVIAMHGDNGPIDGQPKPMGLLLAGIDCVSIDRVAAEIIQAPMEAHFVLNQAQRLGMPGIYLDQIQIHGCPISEAIVPDFRLPALVPIGFSMSHLTRNFIRHVFARFWAKRKLEEAA